MNMNVNHMRPTGGWFGPCDLTATRRKGLVPCAHRGSRAQPAVTLCLLRTKEVDDASGNLQDGQLAGRVDPRADPGPGGPGRHRRPAGARGHVVALRQGVFNLSTTCPAALVCTRSLARAKRAVQRHSCSSAWRSSAPQRTSSCGRSGRPCLAARSPPSRCRGCAPARPRLRDGYLWHAAFHHPQPSVMLQAIKSSALVAVLCTCTPRRP